MKKPTFLIIFSIITVFASAEITPTNAVYKMYRKITATKDTVLVFMFNGINPTDTIKFTGTGNTANWFEYSEPITNTSNYFPNLTNFKDATGYILDVDGKRTSIWIIDYTKYLPVLKSIEPDLLTTDPCSELNLLIDATVPNLSYKTPTGNTYKFDRKFTVKYYTSIWKNETWDKDSLTLAVTLPTTQVPAPLCDTEFKLMGDQYADSLGVVVTPAISHLYHAVAVKSHLKTVVTERDKENEAQFPQDKTPISYSTPFDVQFLSNPSPAATYFSWSIYKDGQLIISRTDKDHRYTFTDYGTYNVKIIVSNATCSYSDSITVNAIDAKIQVTNVFTPNGDKQNDEFRVSYKSLLGFECWVYNRWGRKVFYWNDPQKGWDGKIAGKDAAEGAYFYVIKATGYGLDPKNPDPKIKQTIIVKGNVNLLRGKQ